MKVSGSNLEHHDLAKRPAGSQHRFLPRVSLRVAGRQVLPFSATEKSSREIAQTDRFLDLFVPLDNSMMKISCSFPGRVPTEMLPESEEKLHRDALQSVVGDRCLWSISHDRCSSQNTQN